MSLSLLITAVILEVGTRILVPDATFRVLADIFTRDADPRIGYAMKRDYAGAAFCVPLRTNSLGFRGREWAPAKAAGTLRIALLGDSHAFGYGVAFEQTLSDRLEKRLQRRLARPVEVLNFGVNGYLLTQQLAVLETKVLPLSPDLVLMLTGNNDVGPPLWVDAAGWLRWGKKGDESSYVAADRHQDAFVEFRRQALSRSRFLLWLRIQWLRYSMAKAAGDHDVAQGISGSEGWMPPAGIGPVDESLRAFAYEPLAAVADQCRARNAKVAILTFTAWSNWRTTLNALAADQKIPLLELLPLLEGADSYRDLLEKWSLGWDGHMGPSAQEVWAAGVEEFLVRHSLVP